MDAVEKMARERRWREHVAAWQKSGLSQAEYCRRHGLTQNDFSWWKRTLAARSRVAAPTFVPVSVAAPVTRYPFEISLRGGRVLRFDERVNAAALGAIVRELEAAALQPGARPC